MPALPTPPSRAGGIPYTPVHPCCAMLPLCCVYGAAAGALGWVDVWAADARAAARGSCEEQDGAGYDASACATLQHAAEGNANGVFGSAAMASHATSSLPALPTLPPAACRCVSRCCGPGRLLLPAPAGGLGAAAQLGAAGGGLGAGGEDGRFCECRPTLARWWEGGMGGLSGSLLASCRHVRAAPCASTVDCSCTPCHMSHSNNTHLSYSTVWLLLLCGRRGGDARPARLPRPAHHSV